MRLIAIVAAAAATILAACSPAEPAPAPDTTQPATTVTEPTIPSPERGRLVVIDGSGDVVIIENDGTVVERLTNDDDGTVFQPVWSPDAQRIAHGESDGSGAAVVVTSVDGTVEAEHAVPSPAFYLSWSPSGALSWLRNDPVNRLAFEAVAPGGGRLQDGGSPFYYAWSPDGSGLLAHVGNERLETLSFDGSVEAASEPPGAFAAPAWTERGRFYLAGDAIGQRLVREDASGSRDIARVRGPARFGVAGSRVAIRSFDPEGSGLAAGLAQVPLVPPDRLTVVDLDTGALTDVAGPRTAAFFWAPAGDRLLVLEATGDEAGTFRWLVWTPQETTPYEPFALGDDWVRDVLPFSDQYARSVRLWSPDGSAFAFPGVIGGTAGIWIQRLDADRAELISDGSWVDWAPAGRLSRSS